MTRHLAGYRMREFIIIVFMCMCLFPSIFVPACFIIGLGAAK
jgi:hypothetical protein